MSVNVKNSQQASVCIRNCHKSFFVDMATKYMSYWRMLIVELGLRLGQKLRQLSYLLVLDNVT